MFGTLFSGITLKYAGAGVWGALVYLVITKTMQIVLAITTVFVGLTAAETLTPIVASGLSRYQQWALDKDGQFGLAFLLGFSSMALFKLSLDGLAYLKAKYLTVKTGDNNGNG